MSKDNTASKIMKITNQREVIHLVNSDETSSNAETVMLDFQSGGSTAGINNILTCFLLHRIG